MSGYVELGAGGRSTGGYLAVPGDGIRAPAVLVTSAIAGLNDYVRGVADKLAEEGYVAFALDYYSNSTGPPDLSSPDKIMAAVAALPDREVLADIGVGIEWLRSAPETDGRVGIVGFCIGGTYALLAATEVDGPDCAVSFYGGLRYPQVSDTKPRSPLDAVAKARCPLLGHYGESDHLIPASDVDELRDATRGLPAEVYTYPGAGHAFHEDFRPKVHRPVAAAAAWQRSLTFLRYYLTSTFTDAR